MTAERDVKKADPAWGTSGMPMSTRSRLLVSLGLTALATATLVFIVASRGNEILAAAQKISISQFAGITALSLVPLGLRAESWRVALSGHTRVPFSFAWNITALTVLCGCINFYLALVGRLAFARRFGPRSLTLANLGVAEAAMLVIESVIILGLVAAFATRVGVPLPVGLAGLAAAGALLIVIRRYGIERFSVLRESAFANNRSLILIGSLLAATLLLQVFRVSLALEAVGLPYSLFTAAVAFMAMGVLATLPIGPGSFPAAMALVFVGESLDRALAAGLVFLASSLLAALIAAPAALFLLWRGHRVNNSKPDTDATTSRTTG